MDDLSTLKRQIDLREVALSYGYSIDRKESWKTGHVFRRGGDKIIVKQGDNWHYWSIRDRKDKGTVIDFIKNRTGKSIPDICQELRAWAGYPLAPVNALPVLETNYKDRAEVQFLWNTMSVTKRHAYLESRLIPAAIYGEYWRFRNKVKQDHHGNAVFVHVDEKSICGFEMRNRDFKGFSKGGERGLFLSHQAGFDEKLLLTESGPKVLAYATLFDDGKTRYGDTAGTISEKQMDLITAEINRVPSGSDICAAQDNDAAGSRWGDAVKECVERTNRTDISFTRIQPEGVKDWGDLLERERRPELVRMLTL